MMNDWITYIIIVLVVAVSFLFSPPPQEGAKFCGFYFKLTSFAGFEVNCDASGFVRLAKHPYQLLDEGEARQSRPLYILISSFIGYMIYLPFNWLPIGKNELFYLGYILLNAVSLILGIHLFRFMALHWGNSSKAKSLEIPFMIMLICTPVVRSFFWTAHQQMFYLLGPAIILYTMYYVAITRIDFDKLLIISFLGGIGALMYGTFFLLLPGIVIADWINRFSKINALKYFIITIIFGFPILAYIYSIILINGKFYSHEVEGFRQFIWIIETWNESPKVFLDQLIIHTQSFLSTWTNILPWVILALTFLVRYLSYNQHKIPLLLSGSCILLFFLFFWLLGFYGLRLTYTFYPFMLLWIWISLSYSHFKYLKTSIWLTTITWWVFQVIRPNVFF